MRKIIVGLLCLINLNLFSLDYNSTFLGVTDDDIVTLKDKGYLLNSDVDYKKGLKLIPKEFYFKKDFYATLENYNPELCVEMLFILDIPETHGQDLTAYLQENILAVSEQDTITYFSHRRQKIYPLITKSNFVEGYRSKVIVSDPKLQNPISRGSFTLFQDDTTFDGNYYSVQTNAVEGEIWNEMDNINKLKVYHIFKAMDKEGMRVSYIIKVIDNKIVLYSLVQVKTAPKITNVLGYEINIPDSVRKRIEAVIKWFVARI